MGRVQLFEIRLSQGRVVYGPGEPLAGTVHLRLGAPLPFRAIRVTCMGSCGVSTKANDGAWVVEESYFNSSLSLADKGSLPAGEHNFPFQFLLPATAPTSFEGPFGKIVHQVSMKAPEATVTLPLFVGNIAVNQTPLSPCPGRESSPGTLSLVVPSAPPQEEAEAVASGPHFSDPVSLSTKSHSQQQPLSAPLGSVSVTTTEPWVQVGSPARHSLHPPLCISIGATVPYFAEGSAGPVPTTSALNLNSIPDIEQPNVASTTKKFSYKLVKTGNVVLTASTDLRGYVVGQVLRLQADIENQSGKDTSPVVASLLQKVSYKAKRWIYDVRTIAEVEGTGVKAWRRAQWQEQILVPALPQSALPGCSLIHIDYYLQVSMKAPEATVTLPSYEQSCGAAGTDLGLIPGS